MNRSATALGGDTPLSTRRIARTWRPLAAGWLALTGELSLLSAAIARLDQPEVNLAAWAVVFAISSTIQAPTTMLLAASTALNRDWESYRKMRRFMFATVGFLMGLHLLIAFTPLYDLVINRLIGAPAEIVEPARLALRIMAPWSFGTAYRRFQQGVLIRFGRPEAVVQGSLLRLAIDCVVLVAGFFVGASPGVAVAATAIILGALGEAAYARLRVGPLLRGALRDAPPPPEPLTAMGFLGFYVPLAITSVLTVVVQPLLSAALSRMPGAVESLAVWSVIFSLLHIWQSAGIAYNEVVIALLDEQRAVPALRRFALMLIVSTTLLLAVMAATPLSYLWFRHVAALAPPLGQLAQKTLWIALLMPALRVLQSWYQGTIVYSRRTRSITESVAVFALGGGAVLWVGMTWGQVVGIYVGMTAFIVGFLLQTAWLWYRSRPLVRALQARDGPQPVRVRRR